MKKRLLFVDDEENIRLTLPVILTNEGFDVTVASSVPEAIKAIQNLQFDILLSDLNIGQPGDGFTVVSAMRRIQPSAATLILTGYPDFESALIAIRNQVDDYLTKPADIKKLVEALKEKATKAGPFHHGVPKKRISSIIRENRDEIIERWLKRHNTNAELSRVRLTQSEKINRIPELLVEIADRIESHPKNASAESIKIAAAHGAARHKQGYTIPMLLIEAAILEDATADLLQDHLLAIDISTLISDMHQMSDTINCARESSIRAYLDLNPEPQAV
jgi:ActR/RegA family two-component response regulator